MWQGTGRYDGHEVDAGSFELDETLVCRAKAIEPILIENTGHQDLLVFKFFGPDINPDVPMIAQYHASSIQQGGEAKQKSTSTHRG